VLSSEEATALLAGMDVSTVVGLRDRAIIAVMTYTFARVTVVVALHVEDFFAQKKRWWLRLHEKNGKLNEMPWHHKLEAYLDAAGIEQDRKGPLFRVALGKTKKLGPGRMTRKDVWYMVRRRASDAGIETPIGCHTFRTTGITDYLTNGGRIEVAQRMAGHANAKTTGLYDRRNDDISVGEVEKIGIWGINVGRTSIEQFFTSWLMSAKVAIIALCAAILLLPKDGELMAAFLDVRASDSAAAPSWASSRWRRFVSS
jgi:integrase/recombinase XerD